MSYSIDNIVASEIVLKPSGLSSVDFQKAFLYVTNSEVPESLSDSVGTYKTYTTISQMTADGFYKGRLIKDLRKPIKEVEDNETQD